MNTETVTYEYLALLIGSWNLQENVWCKLFWGCGNIFGAKNSVNYVLRCSHKESKIFVALQDCIFWGATFDLFKNWVFLSGQKVARSYYYHRLNLPRTILFKHCSCCTIRFENGFQRLRGNILGYFSDSASIPQMGRWDGSPPGACFHEMSAQANRNLRKNQKLNSDREICDAFVCIKLD